MIRSDTFDDFIELLYDYDIGNYARHDENALNMANIAEQVILGPQREVLLDVERVNNMHGMDLGITKTFRWKNGYLDQVKNYYEHRILQWTKRNNGIHGFFNRIDNSHYIKERLRRTLTEIDDKLYNLRSQQARFQDNNEAVFDKWEEIQNRIDILEEKSTENIQFKVFISNFNTNHPHLVIMTRVINIEMSIFNGSRNPENLIGVIPWEPTIYMYISFPLVKILNQSINHDWDNITFRINTYHKGLSWGDRFGFNFPYISRNNYDSNGPLHAVCLGDFNTDITQASIKLDADFKKVTDGMVQQQEQLTLILMEIQHLALHFHQELLYMVDGLHLD